MKRKAPAVVWTTGAKGGVGGMEVYGNSTVQVKNHPLASGYKFLSVLVPQASLSGFPNKSLRPLPF